jgi:hypothetical protein
MYSFSTDQKKTILILTANPSQTAVLSLPQEASAIRAALKRSSNRDDFQVEYEPACTPDSLRQALLDYKPQVVHFSGHGAGEKGLVLENSAGGIQLVDGEALAGLFKLVEADVKCVLLNACFSNIQAEAIREHIDYVVGTKQEIGDMTARKFSEGFYDALGAGRTIEDCFGFGRSAIQMQGLQGHLIPTLKRKSDPPDPEVSSSLSHAEGSVMSSTISQPIATTTNSPEPEALKIFISYSREDEDLKNELTAHLTLLRQQGKIKDWHDRKIIAGTEWLEEIDKHFNSADIILLLISHHFIASDYCYGSEMTRAMERHEAGKTKVIPILLSPCDWRDAPFSKLQVLPDNAEFISRWDSKADAFVNIVEGVRSTIKSIYQSRTLDEPRRVGSMSLLRVDAQEFVEPLAPIESVSTSTGKHPRIFISYQRDLEPDQTVARQVCQALKEQYEVHLEDRKLPGQQWAKEIEEKLQQADFFIPFLSAESINCNVVTSGIEKACSLQSTGRPIILPVRLAYQDPFDTSLETNLKGSLCRSWSDHRETPHLINQLKEEILYVEREEEREIFKFLQDQPQPVIVSGSFLSGKSLLLNRIELAAKQTGKRGVYLDFQEFRDATLKDAEKFFPEFCSLLVEQVNLENQVVEHFFPKIRSALDDDYSRKCTDYLREHILPNLRKPLVLVIDDFHRIFDSNFYDDFDRMLRNWHSRRTREPLFFKIDLVLATAIQLPTFGIAGSPLYNASKKFKLTDFTKEEVIELNYRFGSPLDSSEVDRLWVLLNGHSFLTRQSLKCVKNQGLTVTDLLGKITDEHKVFGEHLSSLLKILMLEKNSELRKGMCQVISNNRCINDTARSQLVQLGLVYEGSNNFTLPRCHLYKIYFEEYMCD